MKFIAKAPTPPDNTVRTRDSGPSERPEAILRTTESEVVVPEAWLAAWDDENREGFSRLKPHIKRGFVAAHLKPNPCYYCDRQIDYVPSPLVFGITRMFIRPHSHDGCRESFLKSLTHQPQQTWWDKHCPVQFRNTNVNQWPNPAAANAVLAWQFGSRGLILYGATGRGKTHSVWTLLRRLADEERGIVVLDSAKWADECGERFKNGSIHEWLENQEQIAILFWDDIDKAVFSERVQELFFRVFKFRCENGLPTIITTNLNESIRDRFAPEVGAAFVERIVTHCEAVEF